VLNYNVELGRDVDHVQVVPTLRVRMPLPEGFAPRRCRVIRVEEETEEALTPRVAEGVAAFEVADAGIHTICVLE
jgi:hypothetical protein